MVNIGNYDEWSAVLFLQVSYGGLEDFVLFKWNGDLLYLLKRVILEFG